MHSNRTFHDRVLETRPSDLPILLKFCIGSTDAKKTFTVIAALCNTGRLKASRILDFVESLCANQLDAQWRFIAHTVIGLLEAHEGPRGQYLLDDFKSARLKKAGIAYDYLRHKARKRLGFFMFVVCCMKLWKAFVRKSLEPTSGFVRRYLKKRWLEY